MNADAPILNRTYLHFTPDTPEEAIAARFREKFGVEPEYIFDFNKQLWAGPAPEKQDENKEGQA